MLLVCPFWKHPHSSQIDLFGSVSLQAVQILAPEVSIKKHVSWGLRRVFLYEVGDRQGLWLKQEKQEAVLCR